MYTKHVLGTCCTCYCLPPTSHYRSRGAAFFLIGTIIWNVVVSLFKNKNANGRNDVQFHLIKEKKRKIVLLHAVDPDSNYSCGDLESGFPQKSQYGSGPQAWGIHVFHGDLSKCRNFFKHKNSMFPLKFLIFGYQKPGVKIWVRILQKSSGCM